MIGRKYERQLLMDLADSSEPEFVVVYGRRRVGKTYLVRETFENKFFFNYTGIANINGKRQLEEFTKALREHGWAPKNDEPAVPANWYDAFGALRELTASAVESPGENENFRERKIIFIDEMPWMDNIKSDFVPALEHFWNGWASGKKNIMLIACGSAASWITKKIFRNKGGLYNRVTRQIALKPFTLAECAEFFTDKGIVMNTQDIVECYMIFGGIPYYLRMLEKRYSLAQNIDNLCFGETAPLRFEFARLMDTLFSKPSKHIQILEALHEKNKGLTREAISENIEFGNGGNLTRILNELEESGFIRAYKPFGGRKNGSLYHLSDSFVSFHLTFIGKTGGDNFWSAYTDNAGHRAWSGISFERLCLAHAGQIIKALGISGIQTNVSSWVSRKNSGGAQIDLVIDRADRVINLCEIKFANGPYEIDRAYEMALRDKIETFRNETKTRKALHFTMITTYGVKRGKHSGIVQSEVNMDDLF